MEGHRGGYPSASGSSWTFFEENAKEYESLHGWPGSGWNPISPPAGRLCKEDMAIYGEEPAMDSLSLVVCKQCGRVVKSQALLNHEELYHAEVLKITAPKRIPTPINTVGQSSMAMSTERPSGGSDGEVKGFVATGLPVSNPPPHTSGGKGLKEFDPDRNCGVWIEEERRPCTRSITCKFHSLSLRRRVSGRSKPFDELLELHKKRKKWKRIKHSDANLPVPLESPQPSPRVLQQPSLGSLSPAHCSGPLRDGWLCGVNQTDGEGQTEDGCSRDLPGVGFFPRPQASCSFGSRCTNNAESLVFGRRQDKLRSALARLCGRSADYTDSTLHRKHSYNSLLQEKRAPKRKYFAKINKRPCDHDVGTVSHLRDSRPPPTSLVLTHSLTPVYTPVLFQASTSPLLVGGTGTVSRVPEPPHPITPSQFYGTANEHNPSETTNESNAILTNSATSPVPVAPNPTVAQEPKKKSKRGRRPKRQRNKSKANTTAPLSREQPTDAGPVSNAHNPSPPSLSAMAADMPPHQQQSHHQHHRSGVDTGQTRLPVREMIVRVKQEPLSNHEDEMETTERPEHCLGSPVGKAPQKPHSLALNGMVAPTTPPTTLNPFNSRHMSSPQGMFVINPTGQQPRSHPSVMTSISPHLSGIVPIGHGEALAVAQSLPSLSASQQQHSAAGGGVLSFTQSVQPAMPSFMSEQLQRHMLQQRNALWAAAFASTATNSLNSDTTEVAGRALLTQQRQQQQQQQLQLQHHHQQQQQLQNRQHQYQQQQQQQQQAQVSSQQVAKGGPQLQGGMAAVGMNAGLQAQSLPSPSISGRYQVSPARPNLTAHRSPPKGKVRAPISQVPTSHQLQESASLSPDHYHHRTPTVLNRSTLQTKQTLTQRSHLPSQQVT